MDQNGSNVLDSHKLTCTEAVNLAQNLPLWRLLTTSDTICSQRCMPKTTITTVDNIGRLQVYLGGLKEILTDQMPFTMCNQQCQNAEDKTLKLKHTADDG